MSRTITHIVLHCTGGHPDYTLEAMRKDWEKLGWKRPGYHIVVWPDGSHTRLQPDALPTNGVAGRNANSIHICYVGGARKQGRNIVAADTRTDEQKAKLRTLVEWYKSQFPAAKVLGHRDFEGVTKACPSFDVAKWLKEVGLA